MKKTIQIFWVINLIMFGATLLGFLGFILGFAIMFFLGIIQLIMGIVLTFFWKNLPVKFRNMLLIYWGIVVAFGVGVYLFTQEDIENVFVWGVIPMTIAAYFTFLLFRLRNERHRLTSPQAHLNVLDEDF